MIPDTTRPEPRANAPPHAGATPRGMSAVLNAPPGERGLLAELTRLDALLFLGAMLVYALTRFIGLTRFPIYFFCDEAIQPVQAGFLLEHNLRDHTGTFLPTYFLNVDKWSLGLTVYIHMISVWLFGKSVFVTRATSVVVGMLAPAAAALTLKFIFQSRSWWIAPLVMGFLPAWFLHSRTAFETAMMVAFYACFVCAYLLYRYRSPVYGVVAVVAGAATFYSYTNGQGVMVVSGALLLLSDLPYHLRQVRQKPVIMVGAGVLLVLLVLPMVRFRLAYPDATEHHLQRVLHSYLLRPGIPLEEKVSTFAENYMQGLDPHYWFLYDGGDIDRFRHRIKESGHLPLVIAPFLLLGVGLCLWRWRSSAHRALLIALLAAPFSSALVAIAVYRALAIVVPVTLLACLGFEAAVRRVRSPPAAITLMVASGFVLVALNTHLLYRSLTDGPTWFDDYGRGGYQYGALQLFGQGIPIVLDEVPPDVRLVVSEAWANNPLVFPTFFLTPQQRARVQFVSFENFLITKQQIPPRSIFVLPAEEYEQAVSSGKFTIDHTGYIIPYPNGEPGFYFVHLRYVDTIDQIFAEERAARRRLVESTVTLKGEAVVLRHSPLDMGNPDNIFDGDSSTMMRGREANPFVMEFHFPTPRTLTTLGLQVRTGNFKLEVVATPREAGEPYTYTKTYQGLLLDPRVDYTLPDGPIEVEVLRIAVTNLRGKEVDHIHIWEVEFR